MSLEYNHPVSAPLALLAPMAKARKEQHRYRRYGEMGSLSIETDTFVQHVPMPDCFFVTERSSFGVESTGAIEWYRCHDFGRI
jgi:hypothetical protein|mmetsp:Transcript_13192/g.23873  ORF Transcript_13192/g.23873 Transcript_13192/m.23873 type:complete len:83 (-) Transcript_13192:439-687(-)